MGTHRLSEPFVRAVSKQHREGFVTSVEHLGKISNLQNKQMKIIIPFRKNKKLVKKGSLIRTGKFP